MNIHLHIDFTREKLCYQHWQGGRMKQSFFKTMRFSWVLGIVLALFIFLNGGGKIQAAGLSCGTWTVVPTSLKSTDITRLNGIAAYAQNNVWAVGSTGNNGSTTFTLIEHWTGKSWNVVSSPNVGQYANSLSAIAIVSANDIWAVGTFVTFPAPEEGFSQNLIEHWDGSSWKVVSSPNIGSKTEPTDNTLAGVTAVSTNDVWAVGYAGGKTLIEHWNGKTWSIVSSPNIGTNVNFLYGATAISATDIWAVGDTPGGVRSGSVTLTEHWNGKTWSIVSSPNVGTLGSYLNGVSALASNNVWSVGDYDQNDDSPSLIEHWNGSSWTIVPSPNPASGANILESVSAISSNNIWAVGSGTHGEGIDDTLIEHWNGKSWVVVPSPNPSPISNDLFSVSASSATNVWASGLTNYNNALIESYC
jgi:hypothetical protein